jgi:hypothetical protein
MLSNDELQGLIWGQAVYRQALGLMPREIEQLKIAEPVQNECEVSLAMTTVK